MPRATTIGATSTKAMQTVRLQSVVADLVACGELYTEGSSAGAQARVDVLAAAR